MFLPFESVNAALMTAVLSSRSAVQHGLLLSDCETCDELEMEECPQHPLVIARNTVALEESLGGEPECLTIYRMVDDKLEVGAFAVVDLPRNVRFGPLVEDEEEDRRSQQDGDRTSSVWMRVR